MKKIFNCVVCVLLVATNLIMLNSCSENPSVLGGNIIDEDPFNPNKIDTVTIVSYSLPYDSVITSSLSDEHGFMVGSIYDAPFGITTSSCALSFATTKGALKDSVNPITVDSVILRIPYKTVFGKLESEHTFRVYELDDLLDTTKYYSNREPNYFVSEIGSKTFTPVLDTVDGLVQFLEINLDNSVGTKILNLPNSVLNSSQEFIKEFNGIYVCPDPINTPNSGSMLKLSLKSSETRIRIYYHTSVVDSSYYDLSVGTGTKNYLYYNHNNYQEASQSFKNQVLEGDTTLGNEKLFLQTMGGVMVKITFPFIEEFQKVDNLAIQDAKLFFTVNTEDTYFGVPSGFDLVKMKQENGQMVLINDYTASSNYYNGTLASDTETFFFRINMHLKDMINGKTEDNSLYLHIRNSNSVYGRVLLYGANPSEIENRIKLQITYTTID